MIKKLFCISLLLLSTLSLPMLRSVAKLNQVLIPGITQVHPSYGTNLIVPEIWTIETSATSRRSEDDAVSQVTPPSEETKSALMQSSELSEYKRILAQERAAYEAARKQRETATKQLRVVERKINESRMLYVIKSCDANGDDAAVKSGEQEMPAAPLSDFEKKIQEHKNIWRSYAREKEESRENRNAYGGTFVLAAGGAFCWTAPWAGLELLLNHGEPDFFCGLCTFGTGVAAFCTTPAALLAIVNHVFVKIEESLERGAKEEYDCAVRKLKAIKENSVAVKEKTNA